MRVVAAPIGDPPAGCTCGPYWSVIPPGPCPFHGQMQWVLVPVHPMPHETTRWYPTITSTGTVTVQPATTTTTIRYTSQETA